MQKLDLYEGSVQQPAAAAVDEDKEVSDDDDEELDNGCFHSETSPQVYMAPHIKFAQQVKEAFPLVSVSQSLDNLEAEFGKGKGYSSRLADLKSTYRRIRCVRAEGNSLYRAVAFAIFELMIRDRSLNDRLSEMVAQVRDKLLSVGMEDFVVDELHETVSDYFDLCFNSGSVDPNPLCC
jgi:hypothetical protein